MVIGYYGNINENIGFALLAFFPTNLQGKAEIYENFCSEFNYYGLMGDVCIGNFLEFSN